MRSERRQKIISRLLERDGDACWYCGLPMVFELSCNGKPTQFFRTIEHLEEVSAGGSNEMKNLVLTHGKCNSIVNGMTVAEKVRYRDRRLARVARRLAMGWWPQWATQLLKVNSHAGS